MAFQKWGSEGYSHRGGIAKKDAEQPVFDPYPWLKMVPIKRYKYFTRFCKVTTNGNVYYECYLNSEVDAERKKRGLT